MGLGPRVSVENDGGVSLAGVGGRHVETNRRLSSVWKPHLEKAAVQRVEESFAEIVGRSEGTARQLVTKVAGQVWISSIELGLRQGRIVVWLSEWHWRL